MASTLNFTYYLDSRSKGKNIFALAPIDRLRYHKAMNDQEFEARVAEIAKPLLTNIFSELRTEYAKNGAEVCDAVLYALITSMITTQIVNIVMSEETPEESVDQYTLQKSMVEDAVGTAFTAIMSQVNPGLEPKFHCSITMLDDGNNDKIYC